MTGSLGATSVNRAVSALAHQWRDRTDVSLVHVTGRRDFADIAARAPENCELDYRVVDFADMSTLWRVADVAVCRAGAATVAELDALDIPAVVVPLPGAPGDHQMANAKALATTGRAIVIADADVNQPVFVDAVLRAMSWSSDSRSTPAINNAAASIVRAVDCVGRS
jgi:UDP-N-acetylglucosamine--N-acetylmuramyl-(pentapeptide) pyrophosphoryl-undecaprenol N-acetylglucosamine transferase